MGTMTELINTLRKSYVGHGHYKVTINVDGKEKRATTTNMMAIDAAFDDCYNDEDNSGRFYKSRKEAEESLANEILRNNNIKE